ncbi:class I SAM-dependent methyltransferase [Alsobacter sp. SYSU M60028]|uniref:Class I SAM-dependent methyltransferase n=1 Tax=Alsobacter ponti TaxID=2962936 RepID=A0ABT1LDX5_9HYPH|nr:class I SAM-dependent methyltransferase [Alsobacter ponti]MCP8939697.1 class I SAM-dependent methyltransferase [Alsobacter ponti]
MSDIEQWNSRFGGDEYLFGVEPNAFLRSQASRLRPGWSALAVADGEGRNGVWLAGQGLAVTSVEGSPVAIAKARKLAMSRQASLSFVEADLASWIWPRAAFDVVVAIFIQFADPVLRARLFEGMKTALKPGGLLLLEGYRPEQLSYGTGGPRAVENLYTEALLREAFADFHILELKAYDSVVTEGAGHHGMSALIDLVAQKPNATSPTRGQ